MDKETLIFQVCNLNGIGLLVSAIVHHFNNDTHLPKGMLSTSDVNFNQDTAPDKLILSFFNFDCEDTEDPMVSCVKFEDFTLNQEYSDVIHGKIDISAFLIQQQSVMNIPIMIKCQNCETNFPTKYQYQRHQCEFNAENVVLKPNVDLKNIDKGLRIKFDCNICGKQFVSKNNLDRHQACHGEGADNMCEHCNKQFVSESRLIIHKENHCKKVGDISKFYRSDVAVWKCKKCHEVFSSSTTANAHTLTCSEMLIVLKPKNNDSVSSTDTEFVEYKLSCLDGNDSNQKCIVDVEKILTEILLQCEFCNRTFADKSLLLLHQKKHSTDKNYECVNCKSSFDSFVVAAQHWLKTCSDTNNTFFLPKLTYCEYCDRTFKSHELLYTHKIKKKHYTLKQYKSNCKENVDEKPKDNDESINKLIEDVLITLDRSLVKNHQKESEICETNNKNIEVDDHSWLQTKSIFPDQSFVANQSNKTNEADRKRRGRKRKWSKQNLKNKRNLIDEDLKYQCERCSIVFDNIVDLESHREKEHVTSFTCEECNKVLFTAKALLIHSRTHKSLKPYVCETCGRSYSQTSHLWQHMRFHQGIKPFACPHDGCEARYTIRPDLKDHIRKVHTRERPFRCEVCSKCFLTGSVYYQHRLIHTDDRRYPCETCGKRFFRADALNNHRRIHTDERPYPCVLCGRDFRQKGDRNKHMRTQHPDATII